MIIITALFGLILTSCLLVLSWIDWTSFRLPDKITLPLIILGLIQTSLLALDLTAHIIGAALGYLIFFMIETLYRHIRGHQGLGRGDAKLLAAGGAWCGWTALPYIILLSSLSALSFIFLRMMISGMKIKKGIPVKLPFGPFLGFGIFFSWIAFIATRV